jgi:hypothetical protein
MQLKKQKHFVLKKKKKENPVLWALLESGVTDEDDQQLSFRLTRNEN